MMNSLDPIRLRSGLRRIGWDGWFLRERNLLNLITFIESLIATDNAYLFLNNYKIS